MHRDHKLGLALGVLVVGFAAALCFPKQTDVDQRLLQLENTAELDAEIAQLPVHAYTNADPLTEAPAASVAAPASGVIVPGGDGEPELLAGPPAPIAPPANLDQPAANDLDHELPPEAAAAAVAGQQHIVQPGDTLSSLASSFLGAPGRYLELFDANREILAAPDDLRPGMVLIIPATRSAPEIAAERAALMLDSAAVRGADEQAPDVADKPQSPGGTTPEPRRLFRPAGSQPFLKTQPVSRGSAPPLPPMDASANARDGSVTAPETTAARTYTVRRGDTLEAIAVRTYGDARAVRDLLEANGDVVRDPRRLKPGMKLTLPARP